MSLYPNFSVVLNKSTTKNLELEKKKLRIRRIFKITI